MTDASANGRASKETYLQWRERLAEKHAARREPAAASPAAPANPWDPALLFVTAGTIDLDAPEAVVTDVDEPSDQTIDLRVVGAAPERPTPDRAPTDGSDAPSAPVVDLRLAAPGATTDPGPQPDHTRKDRDDAVMARLEHTPPPVRPLFADTDLAEALRDLNERRLEGTISDEQFRARKAELFTRSSTV